jgi:hypothetical protein
MKTLIEQALEEAEKRERRSRAISNVIDVVLPVLVVICLCLWFERYNILEVKNGEISLMQVYAWGCYARELSRMPTSEIASVSVEKVGATRGGGGFEGVRIYDRAGNVFNEMCFGDNRDRAYEEKNQLKYALAGKTDYRAEQTTQTHYFFFALILAVITWIRWWMIKTVRKADEEQDRQLEEKRKSRAQKSHLNDPGHVVLGNGRSKCLSANRAVQFRKGAGRNHKTTRVQG